MRVMVCQSQGSAISIKSACLISMSKATPDWRYRVFAIQRTRPENVFLSLLFLRFVPLFLFMGEARLGLLGRQGWVY